MAEPPSPNGDAALGPYLERLGSPAGQRPRPITRSGQGVLLVLPFPDAQLRVSWRGVFLAGGRSVEIVGARAPHHGFSEGQGLAGASAEVADLLAEAARNYLERTEELDGELANLQERGRSVPLHEVWRLERRAAKLRTFPGWALVALAELSRGPATGLPSLEKALPALTSEIERVQDIARNVQQGLTDLILLRNAEESNRLSESANQLQRLSNKLSELQNISNIRMLGITYIALILSIIAGVVLIPNTGATILGMPSAAWVPGFWVDVILFVLALVPLVFVFSRPWVRQLLRGLTTYEFRTAEGMGELEEKVAPGAPGRDESSGVGPRP